MTGRRLLLVYTGLLVLSLISTRFQVAPPDVLSAATAPLTRVSVTVADNLRRAWRTVVEERQLAAEVGALRRENDVLRQRNELLTREAARLRQLEIITRTQAPNAVGTAQVVAVDPSPLLARLTLNLGRNAGVRPRMPVTVPAGLVGQVTEVGPTTSRVLALVDPESAVGVTLDGNRGGRGLARGAPPDRLRAEFSRGVSVKVGDTLVTSSLGGVYPVGIPVGRVVQVFPLGPNDVTRTVIVRPAVDVGVVEDVTVLEGL